MKTTVVGNYPKIPSVRDGINLRNALKDLERGKIDETRLEEIYQRTILRVLSDQAKAGIDLVTDGQIRWTELTFPLANSLEGVHPGGLRRFYDNNVYYRMPQITGLLTRNGDIVVDEYRFAAENSDQPIKAVLCGPITFCALAQNHYYKSFDRLADSVSAILADEVRALYAAGCRHFQLDEPSLPLFPRRMDLAAEMYAKIFSGIDGEYGIFIYFNSIGRIAGRLFDLPLTFIGLDLVSHPGDADLIPRVDNNMKLVAGLFDGRNIMLENEKSIRLKVEALAEKVPLDRITLSPSCGLEFLPQKHAAAKMTRMCEVAQKLNSGKAR